jgi:hypothetical protein
MIRQGLERQLVEAGDFDGCPAGTTGGSYLPGIAGKGTGETTKAKSPAACLSKKNNCTLLQHFFVLHSQMW